MSNFCNIYYGLKKKEDPPVEYRDKLLGYGFWESFGMEYREEALQRGTYGKPYLPGEKKYFNISHGQRIVTLVCASVPVGIDAESPRRISEHTVERCCTKEEQAWLAGSVEREMDFLRLWTLKESYMKMTGEGLRLAPDTVGFFIGSTGGIKCNREGFFKQYEVEEGLISLCIEDAGTEWDKVIKIQKVVF